MECHRSLVLVLAVAASCVGCVSPQPRKAPAPATPPPSEVAARKDTAEGKKQRASTEVAFGTYKVREATSPQPNPPLTAQQKEQMLEQARLSFERAHKIDPNYLPAYSALANLYVVQGDFDRALAEYHKGLQKSPQEASLWLELGMCHCRRKDWQQAIQCLQKAHDLDPGNRTYSKALGLTLAAAGRSQEALPVLTPVLGPAEAQCALARMCRRLGQDEQARQHLQRALQLDPSCAGARDMLAGLDAPAPRLGQPVVNIGFVTTEDIGGADGAGRQ
jgi:Tfp pilus assembly protein PilF